LSRIELRPSQGSPFLVRKMVMPRVSLGVHRNEPVVQGSMIVLVLVQGLLQRLHDVVGTFKITWDRGTQCGPLHVRPHMALMRRHGFYRTRHMFMVFAFSRRPRGPAC
jgi:hypothetical protein